MEISIPNEGYEDFTNLERTFYEYITSEKIMSLILSNPEIPQSVYDKNYIIFTEKLKNHEQEKDKFYHKYIESYVEDAENSIWTADFIRKKITISDR